jgi:hypothetical protein
MSSPSSRSDRVKDMQADVARRERNRRLAIAAAGFTVIVIVVAVLVIVKVTGGGSSDKNTPQSQSGLATVVQGVTSVPSSALDSVGAGTAVALKGITGAPALIDNGKPEMLYIGGEFCPYCAASRWGMIVALSRFGTFNGLKLMSSSSTDVYADTPTLTFHGSTFTSSYLVFHGYEVSDRNQKPLENPSTADNTIFHTYDNSPYTSSPGGIPFVDIGGKWALYGTAYDPQVLQGLNQKQVVADLKDPSSDVAQAILGEANIMTAAICQSTNQQPSSVCSASGVTAAAAKLGSGG